MTMYHLIVFLPLLAAIIAGQIARTRAESVATVKVETGKGV